MQIAWLRVVGENESKARISFAIQELSASINMECMFNKF